MPPVPSTSPAYRLVRPAVEPALAPELDEHQQAVVEHLGGPLLVLAGPGTGKTTTLVEAVVRRVERGADPDQVLVLTFSRKAADELRERIAMRVGRTVREPAAYTFHSWCFALLRAHAEPGRLPRLLSQPERDVRIRELLRGHAEGLGLVDWPASLLPALRTRGFAREVAALFDRARERGLDGAALRALGVAHDRPAWIAAATFLDEYLDVLDARGEVDYAGLVAAAGQLVQRRDVAADVHGRYQAVFVDEYQDTDPSQERLLQALAGDGRDLVVVGDPDQSIYGFRGAEVANILGFTDNFPTADGQPAPTLTLGVSRRTGGRLLAASRLIAERLPTPGLSADARQAHRDLSAAGPDASEPLIKLFPSTAEEVTGIADLLRRAHLERGLPWREMAVLVRSGVRSLAVLRRALVAAGVPVSVAADDLPIARDPAVAPLLIGLRVAGDGLESMTEDDARVLLTSPLSRARPAVLRALGRRLRTIAREAGASVPPSSASLLRDALADPAEIAVAEDWMADPVRRLNGVLTKARAAILGGATPEEALWILWDGSGWSRRLTRDAAGIGSIARNADRDLDAVVALFEAAARLEEREPRAGVATLLDELGMQEIPGAAQEERPGLPDAVRLLTAHRSKGLEWDLVVVAGLQDDVWPDLRRRGSLLDADRVDAGDLRPAPTAQSMLTDERRLFYVAMTRARRQLVLTGVRALDDSGVQPSRFLDDLVDELPPTGLAGTDLLAPSSLVARLRRVLQDDKSSAVLKSAAAQRLAALASACTDDGHALVPVADPSAWWGLNDLTSGVVGLHDPAQPLPMSGSSLAAFETCPLRWFFEHEVRARGASTAAQGFGTVVHVLAQLVAEEKLPPDADVLVEQMSEVWAALGFEAAWQRDREREEARAALQRLIRWLAARPDRRLLESEAPFEVAVGDVILRGAADRLEIDDHGKVHVVDFKTSRSVPSLQAAAEHPQLAVYQLAVREGGFSQHTGPDPRLGGAELVFLRKEMSTGLPGERTQPALPDEQPTWADELIERTATSIRDETFPARPNDGCDICAFRTSCPAQDAGDQVVR
jgi:superfamily I DNA/RNA helicase/RecB family exonuclease